MVRLQRDRLQRMQALARVAALGLLLAIAGTASSCLSYKTAPLGLTVANAPLGVSCSSTPAGAAVLVDGRATGFYTPCALDLDEDDWVELRFELPGHRPETRYLKPVNRRSYVLWSDMDRGPRTWRFPIWLDAGDFFQPVQFIDAHSPARVHVALALDLEPDAPAPAPSDAPGARASGPADGRASAGQKRPR